MAKPTPQDADVSAGLQKVLADLEDVCAAQKADPDNKTDPDDAAVWSHIKDIKAALQEAILAQAKDGSTDARNQRLVAETRAVIAEARAHTAEKRVSVTVTAEPRTYTPDGEHSYFLDLAKRRMQGDDQATARLRRYAQEVDVEIRAGSAEGRRAAKSIAEYRRGTIAREQRVGMTSGSTSGGDFVTPQYLVNLWIPYRSPDRSFTNQCTKLPMPAYGLSFNVPAFTNAIVTAQQSSENTGIVHPPNPTSDYQTATLTTQAGAVPISQQLFDRGGYEGSGGAFDAVVYLQAKSQLDASIDLYILTQVLSTAGEVNQGTAVTTTQFYLDLATARNLLSDGAGSKMPGTHVFSTSDFASFITSQVDSEGRPIVVPDAAALASRADDPMWTGWLGLVLPGNLRWFTDDNINTATPPSAQTTILLGTPADALLWEGDPVTFAYPETNAGELSVMLGIRSYVSAMARHGEAFSYITGSGYPTTDV